MAQKGYNTIVDETRNEIATLINNKLTIGLQPAVISLILENVMLDLKSIIKAVKEKENVQYKEEVEAEDNQVEYVAE